MLLPFGRVKREAEKLARGSVTEQVDFPSGEKPRTHPVSDNPTNRELTPEPALRDISLAFLLLNSQLTNAFCGCARRYFAPLTRKSSERARSEV